MTSGRTVRTVAATPWVSIRSPHSPAWPARSRATTSPSGARLRCSSQPTWPLRPNRRIFTGGSGGLRVLLGDPVAVRTALDALHPVAVRQVPLHGLADAGLESLGGTPAQLALDLVRIDGVAAVVARPILHERDELRVAGPAGARAQF